MDRLPSFSSASTQRLFRKSALAAVGAFALAATASPALAGTEPSTKLVRCGEASCLQISGRRADPAVAVSINGHEVAVQGERNWRVHLPVETVREWSAPYARTIQVSLEGADAQSGTTDSVDLPIGLLGQTTDLASLEIRIY